VIIVALLNSSYVGSTVELLSQNVVSLHKAIKLSGQVPILVCEDLAVRLKGVLLIYKSILITIVLTVFRAQVINVVACVMQVTL